MHRLAIIHECDQPTNQRYDMIYHDEWGAQ